MQSISSHVNELHFVDFGWVVEESDGHLDNKRDLLCTELRREAVLNVVCVCLHINIVAGVVLRLS